MKPVVTSVLLALLHSGLWAQYPAASELTHASQEVDKLKQLVAIGAVAPAKLREAEWNLADAQDNAALGRLLYGKLSLEDLRTQDSTDMVAAASRRVERQRERIARMQKLVDAGVSPRVELAAANEELSGRQGVLDLANNRAKLIGELLEMAQAEALAASQLVPGAIGPDMEYFPGKGRFNETDFNQISTAFQKEFGKALPVSARGETAVHRALGYDHRGRVDVGLNPDAREGLWLRTYLSKAEIPYVAFRRAITGSATAPHIHMGLPSPRLTFAETN